MKQFLIILFFLIITEDQIYNPTTFVFPAYGHSYGIRKAGATALFLLMGFKVQFSGPQGLACVRLDAWEDPEDPHDDDELTVYGVNSGQNNIIYNRSMWKLGVYGSDEAEEQLLNRPEGICANSRGDVYVADTGNHRIVRLFNPGHNLNFVTSIGREGNKNGEFRFPRQVTLDNRGNIFVSDSSNHRIQVFDSTNSFLYSFSGNGYLKGPNGIAVTDPYEKYYYVKNNFLIVIDSLNCRINKFDLNGQLLKSISMTDLGFLTPNLEYTCIDYYNQILITDSKNHCIHKFNSNLDYITSFGREGDNDHEFLSPKGITIYRRFGQLFVAEETGAQYYWVGTDIVDPDIKTDTKNILFSFKITEPSYLTADIFDIRDKFVIRLCDRKLLRSAGKHSLYWNGIVQKINKKILQQENFEISENISPGKVAPGGMYRIRFSLEATYSSRTHFMRIEEKKFRYDPP